MYESSKENFGSGHSGGYGNNGGGNNHRGGNNHGGGSNHGWSIYNHNHGWLGVGHGYRDWGVWREHPSYYPDCESGSYFDRNTRVCVKSVEENKNTETCSNNQYYILILLQIIFFIVFVSALNQIFRKQQN